METGETLPEQRLALADLDGVAVDVLVSPMPTVVEAVRDVVSDRPPAVLAPWQRQLLRTSLRPEEHSALAAFRPTGMPSDGGPNQLMAAAHGATMEEEIERVAATDAARLGAEIEVATSAGRPTRPWRHAGREPVAFLRHYTAALRVVWRSVEPVWRAAASHVEREAERVRSATARHGTAEVVRALYTAGRIVDGEWRLPSHTPDSGRLRVARTFQLVPLVAASPAGGWGDDYGNVLNAARYPLRGRTGDLRDPLALDQLDALLGVPRARILRMLERPSSAGELARGQRLAPGGLTRHLAVLEAAQLVTRTPEGRHVIVARTARGAALVALFRDGI